MAVTIKQKLEALDILKTYKGANPFILMLQRDVCHHGKEIEDFQCEYVVKNHSREAKEINKVIKLADWYQVKKKDDWNLEFLPEKLVVKWFLGETKVDALCNV